MLVGRALRHQMILPEQQYLYDYWRSKCRNGKLPSHRDINPSEIHEQLPMISLLESKVSDADIRFKYRLAGTGFWNLFDSEITGKYVDELPIGDRCQYWHRVLSRVHKFGRPSAGVTRPGTPARSHLAQFWIRLPLSEDGVNVSMILGYDVMISFSEVAAIQAMDDKITA
ncbi:MAG: PAS domain-containing protein [Robiginitomaculum sp.]|nr:PAS domain-containing protein [Robiginitomaculum sp.]